MAGSLLTRRFLGAIGADSEEEFVERSLESVRGALIRAGEFRPPIRLSRIAAEFGIATAPRFRDGNRYSSIEFSCERGLFEIVIASGSGRRGSPGDLLIGRQRFSYAHEFAHRFCFSNEGGTWRRALTSVVAGLPSASRARGFRELHAYEEALCNRIASRLLLPSDLLLQALAGIDESGLFGNANAAEAPLERYLFSVTQRFDVSLETAIVALGRAEVQDRLGSLTGTAVFMLHESRKRGRRLAAVKPRIRVCALPRRGKRGGQFLLPPGLALENLSEEFADIASRLLRAEGSGRYRWAGDIHLRRRKSPKKESYTLDAALYHWGAPAREGQLLAWGMITSKE